VSEDRKAELARLEALLNRVSEEWDAVAGKPLSLKARQDAALFDEVESGRIAIKDIGRVRCSAEAAEAFAAKVLGRRRKST
jgi:hypothetical protein